MEIYKKVLAVLVCVFTIPVVLFLGGCHERSALEEKKEIEFPVNETDETTEILLKWANINEVDKLFKDKKEDYLLKISVSY